MRCRLQDAEVEADTFERPVERVPVEPQVVEVLADAIRPLPPSESAWPVFLQHLDRFVVP